MQCQCKAKCGKEAEVICGNKYYTFICCFENNEPGEIIRKTKVGDIDGRKSVQHNETKDIPSNDT